MFFVMTVAARPNGDIVAQTAVNITIIINDVPEPPVFTGPTAFDVYENQTTGIDNTFGVVQGWCACKGARVGGDVALFQPVVVCILRKRKMVT